MNPEKYYNFVEEEIKKGEGKDEKDFYFNNSYFYRNKRIGMSKKETINTNETIIKISKNSSTTLYKGKTCKATLVEVKGNTAKIVFESDSNETEILTKNLWEEIDIDKDGISDLKINFLKIGESDATLSIMELSTLNEIEILDEAIGGVAPFKVKNRIIDFSLVENKDDLVLLYSGGSSRWIIWEKYDKNGNQINTPSFGGGKLKWKRSIKNLCDDVEVLDAVQVKDNTVVAFENDKGIYLATYNKNLDQLNDRLSQPKAKTTLLLLQTEKTKFGLLHTFLLKVK
ncbi:hypothetical protein [Caldisericum exile]|uniref:Uncharacterized protein n=1 Tax=Caldisericum exile (strain DSM 21853 / NBRC 104410 / AZM16c01) TaxID=511051 RepID=A0A7U6JGK3_CALEA|nr:hypothetical protein [Caldisericum exile]BAL80362.1 hypothetical protein CSE_02360 [Caldisericum exile AZM16c01]